jgi:hypothetical protein
MTEEYLHLRCQTKKRAGEAAISVADACPAYAEDRAGLDAGSLRETEITGNSEVSCPAFLH